MKPQPAIDYAKWRLPEGFGPNHEQWEVPSLRQRYLKAVADAPYSLTPGYIYPGKIKPTWGCQAPDENLHIVRRLYRRINLMVPTYGRSATRLPIFVESALAMSDGNICFTFCINEKDKATEKYLKDRFEQSPVPITILYEALPKPNLAAYFNMMYAGTLDRGNETLVSMVGDDMEFKTPGYDSIILETVNRTDGKVIVYCNDNFIAHDKCCVNMFTTRHLVEATGLPFMCDRYAMDMIDVIWTDVGRALGCLYYLKNVIIQHNHSSSSEHGKDDTFLRLQEMHKRAYSVPQKVKADYVNTAVENVIRNWNPEAALWSIGTGGKVVVSNEAADPVLSILICHLPKRKSKLAKLMRILKPQVDGKPVQVIIDEDEHVCTGTKRYNLMLKASGKYVCFVDDDDTVSKNYVKLILNAAAKRPDCIGMAGIMRTRNDSTIFRHSIEYDKWDTVNGEYVRCPNHLNPIKREIALKVGFPPITVGEDREYSYRVRPLLKTEVNISDPIYFYQKG